MGIKNRKKKRQLDHNQINKTSNLGRSRTVRGFEDRDEEALNGRINKSKCKPKSRFNKKQTLTKPTVSRRLEKAIPLLQLDNPFVPVEVVNVTDGVYWERLVAKNGTVSSMKKLVFKEEFLATEQVIA